MTTFRSLIGNINKINEKKQKSPLEVWFESVLDVPIEDLEVEDICRAIRQKICIDQLLPKILTVLTKDPFAGEFYDGELIAALSTIDGNDLQVNKEIFMKIRDIINGLDRSDINNDLRKDILKINQIKP
ncbi:contact-dependent growth inhibition system immunity protein [Pantoea ananatis]|uniref:contact-dependent growth inhibition system immunity protein n=1 Tax=Pantoea ananas TaxID=553 RepID=UPI0023AF9AEA|nr:contact-dependent growth inhibition system immunity protein [Pantoea ananatis]